MEVNTTQKMDEVNDKTKYWETRLKEMGYRLSGPRRIILSKLSENREYLSADDIYMMVKKENPNIGIATVYRTLELLTRLDLICKISLGSYRSFYMLSENCKKEATNYLICNKCGRIITNNKCLDSNIRIRLKEDAEKNIFKNCRIKIDNYQIFFTGLCDKCA
ncbi:MAG: transcriptional repressor [Actinobacteria bacterium]|nr:transcriptional repressor [Actinomycetota bacterium]